MKRLLIYLGLLATLLAMPYHAKAEQNWAYYLCGSFNNWANEPNSDYKFGDTSSFDGEITWSKSISGSTLLTNSEDNTAYFKVRIIYTGDSQSKYDLGATSGYNTVITLESSCEINSEKGDNAIQINNVQANHNYMITFVSSSGRNSGKITVTDVGAITPTEEAITLRTDAYKDGSDWIGISYNEYNSTTDTYTWYLSSINDFTTTSYFKLEINGTWFGGNGSAIGTAWSTLTSPGQDCTASYSAPSSGNAIRLEAKKNGNDLDVHIVEGDGPHDYYWVSPQITNGEMWPAFKMVASRNRYWSGTKVIGDGLISTKYYTFTIKDDDLVDWKTKNAIDAGTTIRWYILRDDGKVVYRPKNDQTPRYLPHENSPYDTNHPISGNTDTDEYVSFINYWNGSDYDGATAYKTTEAPYNTGSWAFNKGSAKAHTFNLNAEKGHVLYNYTNKGASTSRGYNLVGNWTAGTKVSISLSGGKPMTKYWFKGGVGQQIADNVEVTDADSIVYKVNVAKPAEGWGGLYLDISPSDNGTDDNDTNWGKVFRPLITTGNNLDGRALHGALTTRKDEQSLNPETSDDYLGYTFSFNATTMTYRLEFHTSLYLVGLGVSATKGEGSWDMSNVGSSDPRIRLTPTQEAGHYRNRVYFTQGKEFRFIQNTDEASPTYQTTWMENTNAPKWVSAESETDYYPVNPVNPVKETQYKNYLVFQDGTGSSANNAPSGTSVTFDLPDGWYYVNFYPKAAPPYYTIEHSMELRDFNDVYYRAAGIAEKRNVNGRNGYNFLRVWSDHIAWNKPDNIDVFVVSAFGHNAETHETTATLTKLDVDYIPAKTGVILGCKLSKDNDNLTSGLVYDNAATLAYTNTEEDVNYYNTLTAELTPYSDPSKSYDGTSKLIPLYGETSLQRFSDETGIGTGDGFANYLFGFYRCKNYSGKDNDDFQMGFWLTTGIGKTYANSAFLHLTKQEAEDLGVGTTYDTVYDTSASRASAPAFMLLFDESDDNVITGISNITTAKGNSVASQGWYTLQGVRTAKPTQRGIYIYNGKKVIVND